ncbi:MAG: carbohydrate binding domain-containing protein [Verrucomicrobia bacterium]|nr:carbohydrate binding domain-containing protein [Verrucomicrobiota bacterium]
MNATDGELNDANSGVNRGCLITRFEQDRKTTSISSWGRLILIGAIALGLAAVRAEATNLVANGSLDTWSSGLPTSWSHTTDPTNGVTSTVTADTDVGGAAGAYSAKINCTVYPAPGSVTSTSHADLFQTGIGFKAGTTYKVSFYAKGGINNQNARVAIFNTATWAYSPLYQYMSLGTGWQRYVYYVNVTQDVPSGSSLLWFTLDEVGTLWLDDVEIVETNLVANGSFETWASGLPTSWSHTVDPGNGVTSTVTSDTGYMGTLSAKINCTVYPTGGGITSTSHADLYQTGFSLTGGLTYTVSFWAKGSAGSPALRAMIYDTSTWASPPLYQSIALGTSWTFYTFNVTPAQTIASGNMLLWLTLDQVGTVWLDGVQVMLAQPSYNSTIPAIGSTNLIPNSGFEAGKGGWGTLGLTAGWGGNPVGLIGTLDTSSPHGGSSSLRIDLGSGNTKSIYYDVWPSSVQAQVLPQATTLGWMEVDPSQSVTLSAYLKASQANTPVRLSLRTGLDPTDGASPGVVYTTVNAGTSWQRYTFTANVPNHQVYAAIGPDLTANPTGTVSLWIDDVQLEQGTSATTYQAREPVEVEISGNAFGNIYTSAQTPSFTVAGRNNTGSSTTVSVTVALKDYFGAALTPQSTSLTIGANSSATGTFTPTLAKKGYYRLTFSWTANSRTHSRDMILAYVDGYSGSDSPFGINHAPGTSELCQALKLAGVTWARDWSLVWGNLEPTSGSLNFAASDTQIQREIAENMNVLALVPLPSTNWSSAAPVGVQPYQAPSYAGWARMSYAPTTTSQLTGFIQSAITHYASSNPGKVKTWEFLNEPVWTAFSLPGSAYGYPSPSYAPADYVSLLHSAYTAIKASDSTAKVIGGFSAEPWRYTSDFVTAGGLSYIDILNLHNYGGLVAPETYISQMDTLHTLMSGNVKPIWMTEFAYYGADDLPWTPWFPRPGDWAANLLLANEKQAADWTIRNNVIMLARGVQKIFYHSGTNGEVNSTDWTLESPLFSCLNNLGQPRKLYAAQAELTYFLGSAPTYAADLSKPSSVGGHSTAGVYGFSFQVGGNAVMVVWADETAPYSWGLTVPSGTQVYDIMGNNLGTLTGRLGNSPLYFVSSTLSAATLAASGTLGP